MRRAKTGQRFGVAAIHSRKRSGRDAIEITVCPISFSLSGVVIAMLLDTLSKLNLSFSPKLQLGVKGDS
jgi:hypothetical protein